MKSHAGLSVTTFFGFIKLCWLLKLCRRSLPYIGQSLIDLVGSSCPWRPPIPNVSTPNTIIELRIGIARIFSSRVLFRNRPLSITTGTPRRIQKGEPIRCVGGQFGISERLGDTPDAADVAAVEI